jgi:polyribonucleotide nucleotidyltransferase
MQNTSIYTLDFAGKTLTLETGHLAPQATSSVLARLGDTMVLATVVAGNARADIDYFPLSVEYVERLYAGGKIKGSRWVKREGRPSDEAILTGRLIDRSIRPLFAKEYKNDVQVVVTVLSVDGVNEPDILSLIAVSACLSLSPIPWSGPIGAIRVGLAQDKSGKYEFILNPTTSEIELSELDLVLSQLRDKTVMIEAGAEQVPENLVLEAIKHGHEETSKVINFIEDLAKKAGQKKVTVQVNTKLKEVISLLEKSYKKEIIEIAKNRANKETGHDEQDKLINTIYDHEKSVNPGQELDKKTVGEALEKVMFKYIRSEVIGKSKRVDGRKIDELRPLNVEVGILPRTHGSAIFQRGLTQALTVATLGSPRLEQIIESAGGEETKRYMHHYSMPPYSVGETGRMISPSRREIGHGALAERALMPVIPAKDVFPYTIRVVSEITSSNGSTSMASTCGSTLALMDAGVPIVSPVAGISVGLMSEGDKYVLLTDIIGLEDFSGDMDFKVAGTEKGITAIQLDVKIPGITVAQIGETFERALKARMQILEKMHTVIPNHRQKVSEYAPKIELVQIPVDKIGEVIGPGGKNIRLIIAQTGANVDVEDDGTVSISGISGESVQKAVDWIKGMTREVTPGEEFEGVVKRILPFGAFVEYLPGKEGMVHVSKMSRNFVKHPEEVVSIGQQVKVKVLELDQQGRINLSMVFDDAGGDEPRGGPAGEQQPRQSFERQPREQRGETRRSDHPLSRQFQREKFQSKPRKRFR